MRNLPEQGITNEKNNKCRENVEPCPRNDYLVQTEVWWLAHLADHGVNGCAKDHGKSAKSCLGAYRTVFGYHHGQRNASDVPPTESCYLVSGQFHRTSLRAINLENIEIHTLTRFSSCQGVLPAGDMTTGRRGDHHIARTSVVEICPMNMIIPTSYSATFL